LRINEEVNLPGEVKAMRKIQDRKITRENKKKFNQEEKLDSKNAWGISDPTPMQMVNGIIDKERRQK